MSSNKFIQNCTQNHAITFTNYIQFLLKVKHHNFSFSQFASPNSCQRVTLVDFDLANAR